MTISIARVRPQSKRKALNAQAFAARYLDKAATAEADGDTERAAKFRAKHVYWLDRFNRLTGA